MADKRYYWLKLKEDFFEDNAIEWLEEQKNGKEYCLFYLKLCLRSLRSDGILIRDVGKMIIPYDVNKLAEITKTDVDTVIVAMELFKKIGLVEVLDDGALYMTQLNTMVGSECGSASRVRKMREQKTLALHCNKNVTTEKEKELEIDKDKEIEQEKECSPEPVNLFDIEKAWNDTFNLYPKKTGVASAKVAWQDKLINVIEPNRKDVAILIYKATKEYLANYTANNPDDTDFRYLPKFKDWLNEDCDYWISIIEKKERRDK